MSDPTPLPYENPRLLGINKLPAHVPLQGDETLLDGPWQFLLTGSPTASPPDFASRDCNTGHWDRVTVPHTWQMPRSGATLTDRATGQLIDRPIYLNVRYPFPLDPPRVPAANPTGHYRRSFRLERLDPERRYRLIFDSADSYLEVHLNGRLVGVSKDSRLPAEFDVTHLLTAGENLLACRVLKYCDGSYLEDQDMWRLSGLQRSVRLLSLPRVHIADYEVRAEADGSLRLTVIAGGASEPQLKGLTVAATLSLRDAKTPLPGFPISGTIGPATTRSAREVILETKVPGVRTWSADDPFLYDLVLSLRGAGGGELDRQTARIGFRTVRLEGGFVTVNGRRITFCGVNRHEFDCVGGKCVSDAQMLTDIRLLKRANINAVRTSHYPNCTRWYELCDEHGIYVIDEANIETHGAEPWGRFAHDPEWFPALLDRCARMLERDKNHPSILFWSLGNESGYGPSHDAMAGYVRSRDPTRLVHYEVAGTGPATDVICPMYASIEKALELATLPGERRPVIQCEYAHAMGNATGNLREYWDWIWEKPARKSNIAYWNIAKTARLQGGFIWDWADQGILMTAPDGRPYYAYGGDFGEADHDGAFCNNGIVAPDRRPHPGYFEAKWCHRRVAAELVGVVGNVVTLDLHNRHDHADLSHLQTRWRLLIDGEEAATGPLDPGHLPAGQTRRLSITLPDDGDSDALVRTLRIESVLRAPAFHADAGYIVAEDELVLPAAGSLLLPHPRGARVSVENEGPAVRIRAGACEFAFANGALAHWRAGPHVLLDGMVQPEFYRAATDNDRGGFDSSYHAAWVAAGLDRLELQSGSTEVLPAGAQAVLVRSSFTCLPRGLTRGFEVFTVCEVGESGVLFEVAVVADADLPPIPRIGLRLSLPASFNHVRYLGRGPHENYCDRNASAFLGVYESEVDELSVPYIFPAEHGGRTDLRRLTLTGPHGQSLTLRAESPMQFALHRCTTQDLDVARHTPDIPRRPHLYLYLDHRHMGVGGDAGWVRSVRSNYLIQPGVYRFAFSLET